MPFLTDIRSSFLILQEKETIQTALLNLKLTRIKDLKISSDTFIREVENIPKIELAIKNESIIPVKLKFSPKAAFRVYDEFTDSVSKDDQGNLYVDINLPDNETLFSYLLSFGDNVEILKPDYLRQRIKEKLALIDDQSLRE